MSAFIVRRLIQAVIVIFLVSLLVFIAIRLLPGDPITMIASQSQLKQFTKEQLNLLRHQYGLDKPLPVQYIEWVGGIFKGNLGKSITQNQPVTIEISKRITVTLYIGLISFLLGIIVGVPVGVISAIRRGKWIDTVVTFLANIGITVPVFWLALLLVYVFSLKLHILPVFGYTSPFTNFVKSTKQLILPVFCLAIFGVAANARQTRSAMLEVMSQDYIRTAWSKGLRERVVIMRHALKNGLIPIVTLVGIGVSSVLGGSVLVETVFAIPGMGRLLVTSVNNLDYPYIQAIVLIIAVSIVMANLLVDLSYIWIDPRVHYQ